MSTTPFDPIFRESCVDIHKADCSVSTRLIDPCTCNKYFLCVNNNMVPSQCPPGTAYDHSIGAASICRNDQDIYLQNICNQVTPWTRCKQVSNITDQQLTLLEARCKGITITTTSSAPDGSSNVGAIVGGVLAGIIVIVLFVVGYILYRRGYTPSVSFKKKETKSKHPIHSQPSINNPQYFGQNGLTDLHDHNIYEEYSTIDDSMHDPHYSREPPCLPNRPPSTQSNPTGTGDRKISVTSVQTYMEPSPSVKYGFDNPGLDISEENQRHTNDDRFYTEILPDIPSNGHVHNRKDDISPYDNSNV